MDFDLEELAAIIEQLDKTEFTDFSFEKGDLRIRVRRGGYIPDAPGTPHLAAATNGSVPASDTRTAASAAASQPTTSATPSSVANQPPAPSTTNQPTPAPSTTNQPTPAPSTTATAERAEHAEQAGLTTVKAPMLGHFYRSPKPGEPPFVQVGDRVEADSVVCIIEVMKLMNSVPAGVAGEVVEVYVNDGDLVEFDQPMFAVRPVS